VQRIADQSPIRVADWQQESSLYADGILTSSFLLHIRLLLQILKRADRMEIETLVEVPADVSHPAGPVRPDC
jgi:hypothetical protein